MTQISLNWKSILAIFLVVLAAIGGISARLYLPGITGQVFFIATRIWMLGFPLVWFLKVEKGKLSFSPPTRQEWQFGVVLGLAMGALVLGAYAIAGTAWIAPTTVRAKAAQIGLDQPWLYLLSAGYFTVINSLVEEYVWRGFVHHHCEKLISGIGAIALSALCFTLHHTIALAAYTQNWIVVSLGSLGVFVAGAAWSGCYKRFHSLWAAYISHLLADLAIAIVGWQLLFG